MSLQYIIEETLTKGDKAFVPYIMAGDGGLDTLKPTILKLQQIGVTAIEVGIPFTDPVADGPTIEEAGQRALSHGVTLRKVLAELTSFAEEISVPLVAMTYLNPILAYGVEEFARHAFAAGIRGLIVPDMPFEESSILHSALKTHGIALVQLVSLTSPPARVKKLAAASEGFIYAVTVNGTTGVRAEFAENLPAHFTELKQHSAVPVLAGFGISTPEQVKEFSAFSDGVIVGSQIVSALAKQDWATIEALVNASKKVGIV